ncbi:MAG: helix-turn-helix domain-containing protein [Terracidiphilus sp.]
MTLAEAPEYLRVHSVTLRKRAVAWGVPHKRFGSEWRFLRDEIEAWLRAH